MAEFQENLETARLVVERWNANDLVGVLELFAEDAVMLSGPDWPEQASWEGLDGIRRNMEEWREVWESSRMEFDRMESFGNRIVGSGAWTTRGRSQRGGRADAFRRAPDPPGWEDRKS
jgi:ketosteroid isomerase-like protein